MEIGECNKKAKNDRKSSLPFICPKLSKVILVQETINCKTGLRTFFLVKMTSSFFKNYWQLVFLFIMQGYRRGPLF